MDSKGNIIQPQDWSAARQSPWIAVASGKGGTGKTSVAVSLFQAARRAGRRVQLIDADVEGPNSHHFLGLGEPETFPVEAMLPRIDPARCTLCGECAAFCNYQALAVLGDRVMVFPDMCHGCEGCRVLCPAQAIENGSQEIGRIMHWRGEGFEVWQGRLHVGQVLSPTLIRELHARAREAASGYDLTIVDSPPGTSCPMMAAVRGADRLVLVTEPTAFGLHDLDLAMAAVRCMKVPVEVIINRSIGEDGLIDDLCNARAVPVIARFAEDRSVATAYAEGRPMIDAGADWARYFDELRRHMEAPC
ncbi:MAG TPA: ATP-binding protein [Candidatus Ozemobacteraceae bacterium]|nr:ATP-binding protein [Candidatus Ozemobacteraceae bacterium]